MKLKENFILRQVADTWAVLSLWSENANFNGMLTLNDSGAFLWKALEQGADKAALIDALCAEYEVERSVAEADVAEFLNHLAAVGCLEV